MRKYLRFLLPICILSIAAFLRFYHLNTLPLDLHIDEAGLGLNAWSIANFGTDRYGNIHPIFPANFYGEQSSFYTYICALFVRLCGLNVYSLRLPAALLGMLTVLFGALILREKWGEKGFYTGLLLFSFCPYFISGSRYALDCNAMLPTLTIALFALIKVFKRSLANPDKKYYIRFLLLGFLFGIVLYTYIIAAPVLAIFFILFGLYYLYYSPEYRRTRLIQLCCIALPLLLLSIPMCIMLYLELTGTQSFRTPLFSITRTSVGRVQEISLASFSWKEKIKNLLRVISTDGKYGSPQNTWVLFRCSIPFLLFGFGCCLSDFVHSLRKHKFSLDCAILILTCSEFFVFLLCGNSNYHINGVYTELAYFCAAGLLFFYDKMKNHIARRAYLVTIFCIYLASFCHYTAEYYFPAQTPSTRIYNGIYNIICSLPEMLSDRQIYVLDEVGEFYLLSSPIPPEEMLTYSDSLGYVRDYHNIHFYAPETYAEDDIIICSKASPWVGYLSDSDNIMQNYQCFYTDCYCIFIDDDIDSELLSH